MTLSTLVRGDAAYPELLETLRDPPGALYLRGERVDLLRQPAVAIVGARSCSPYGAHVGRMLGRELAAAGAMVVSGLARGIDGEAHRGALEAGGHTVAVLGCGIDRDYPARHAELARRIADTGLVVSEYPAGVEPAPWRFPARNRIIAALALALVVVEARSRSGALSTVDFALELGREVFAVPGEITSALSAGTNELIRQGAPPLLAASDLHDVLGLELAAPLAGPVVSAAAQDVLNLLARGLQAVDEVVAHSALAAPDVAAALVELELAGLVAQADGAYRALATPGVAPATPG